MNIATEVSNTDLSLSYPWSTKLRTHSSTVEIIEVNAANESAKKNPDIIIQAPVAPPGACAKTSGSARKVIAEEPPVTVSRGFSETAKIADNTVKPAIMDIELLARPIVKAFNVVSSSFLM